VRNEDDDEKHKNQIFQMNLSKINGVKSEKHEHGRDKNCPTTYRNEKKNTYRINKEIRIGNYFPKSR
jgi:hypothetical protein